MLRSEQGPVAGARIGGEDRRGTVLGDATRLDHQHPLEVERLADVMNNAEECCALPEPPDPAQQLTPPRPIEPAERLVEDHQPRRRPEQGPPEPDPLPLAAGEQPAPLAQRRLEPVRQASEEVI